jgi:hypothetical protein
MLTQVEATFLCHVWAHSCWLGGVGTEQNRGHVYCEEPYTTGNITREMALLRDNITLQTSGAIKRIEDQTLRMNRAQ